MAHSLSSRKRIRQIEKRNARNRWRLKTMRDAIREFQDKLVHGSLDEATTIMRKTARIVDRTAAKGVIHKNQAARRKSRMSAALKAKKTGGSAAPTSRSAPKPTPKNAAAPKGAAPKSAGKSK
jgi:small subunit ribosomal protein S20